MLEKSSSSTWNLCGIIAFVMHTLAAVNKVGFYVLREAPGRQIVKMNTATIRRGERYAACVHIRVNRKGFSIFH